MTFQYSVVIFLFCIWKTGLHNKILCKCTTFHTSNAVIQRFILRTGMRDMRSKTSKYKIKKCPGYVWSNTNLRGVCMFPVSFLWGLWFPPIQRLAGQVNQFLNCLLEWVWMCILALWWTGHLSEKLDRLQHHFYHDKMTGKWMDGLTWTLTTIVTSIFSLQHHFNVITINLSK